MLLLSISEQRALMFQQRAAESHVFPAQGQQRGNKENWITVIDLIAHDLDSDEEKSLFAC